MIDARPRVEARDDLRRRHRPRLDHHLGDHPRRERVTPGAASRTPGPTTTSPPALPTEAFINAVSGLIEQQVQATETAGGGVRAAARLRDGAVASPAAGARNSCCSREVEKSCRGTVAALPGGHRGDLPSHHRGGGDAPRRRRCCARLFRDAGSAFAHAEQIGDPAGVSSTA